jgi:hypothetical protein
MMKYLFLIACLCHFTLDVNSQFLSTKNPTMTGHSVYGEIYGAGQGVTLNYDRVVCSFLSRWNGSVSVGFGSYNKSEGRVRFISTPVGLNLFKGKNGHHKELSLHLAYVKGKELVKMGTFIWYNEGLYFTPAIGYRYQKEGGGFLIRLQYSPFVKLKEYGDDYVFKRRSRPLTHSVGISAGYYFARKR